MALTPEKLRKPWNMVPLCIFSLAVGLLLLFYLAFPEIFPRPHQTLMERHLAPVAAFFGILCVLMPVSALYWAIRKEGEKEEDAPEKDDEDFY